MRTQHRTARTASQSPVYLPAFDPDDVAVRRFVARLWRRLRDR